MTRRPLLLFARREACSDSEMKFVSLIASMLFVFASHALVAAPTSRPFFPIMAWSGVPDDPAALKQMRDCGITVVGPSPAKYLDVCASVGMQLLIDDPRAKNLGGANAGEPNVRKDLDSLIAETGKHPANLGYYIVDEPGSAAFEAI